MLAARGAGIEDVVVTTDGADIAAEARALGCTVVDRPAELATGDSRTVDAVLHAVRSLTLADDTLVLLLQPTSPLRTGDDVRAVLRQPMRDRRAETAAAPGPRDDRNLAGEAGHSASVVTKVASAILPNSAAMACISGVATSA